MFKEIKELLEIFTFKHEEESGKGTKETTYGSAPISETQLPSQEIEKKQLAELLSTDGVNQGIIVVRLYDLPEKDSICAISAYRASEKVGADKLSGINYAKDNIDFALSILPYTPQVHKITNTQPRDRTFEKTFFEKLKKGLIDPTTNTETYWYQDEENTRSSSKQKRTVFVFSTPTCLLLCKYKTSPKIEAIKGERAVGSGEMVEGEILAIISHREESSTLPSSNGFVQPNSQFIEIGGRRVVLDDSPEERVFATNSINSLSRQDEPISTQFENIRPSPKESFPQTSNDKSESSTQEAQRDYFIRGSAPVINITDKQFTNSFSPSYSGDQKIVPNENVISMADYSTNHKQPIDATTNSPRDMSHGGISFNSPVGQSKAA